MPGVAPQPAQQPSFFQNLVDRVGLGGALQLLSLLNPNGTAASKGLAAGNLAQKGLSAFGFNPTFGDIGMNMGVGKVPILPSALTAAGIGVNLADIAGNPNYSTGQKVGHAAFDTGATVASVANPYVGLGVLARNIVGQLTKSGSPQVAATGRALQGPALPVEGLISVITGDATPKEAFNNMITSTGQIPVVGHAMKQALQVFGLGTPDTQGTTVRKQIGNIAGQVPALKGFQMGQDVLNADQYNSYKPETQKSAYALADLLGSYSPDYKKKQSDYQIQLGNSLLSKYGDTIPDVVRQILSPQQAPAGAITSAAQLQANSNNNWATNLVNRYKQTGSVR